MCIGSIALLVDSWDDGGARVGRLDDGTVVSLALVGDAAPGAHLLIHLGIPVEILDPDAAREALALRASSTDTRGVAR
jgi:hydrogenase maturation factor